MLLILEAQKNNGTTNLQIIDKKYGSLPFGNIVNKKVVSTGDFILFQLTVQKRNENAQFYEKLHLWNNYKLFNLSAHGK